MHGNLALRGASPDTARFARALGAALLLEASVLALATVTWHVSRPVSAMVQSQVTEVHLVLAAQVARTVQAAAPKAVTARPRAAPAPQARPVRREAAPVSPLMAPVAPARPKAMATAPADQARVVDRYAAALRAVIQAHIRVFGEIAVLHLTGDAVIAFELTPGGQVVWARLARSSGMGPIDEAALAVVRARHFPPFPAGMPEVPTTFQVTAHYGSSVRH